MITFLLPALLASSSFGAVVKRQTENPSGPVDPTTVKDCTFWYDSKDGDSCDYIQNYYGLTRDDLVKYNPSLKSDCSGFKGGNSYCLEENYGLGPATTPTPVEPPPSATPTSQTPTGPGPTQTGLISTCKTFYKVVKDDTCGDIVAKYGTFTLDDFYGWNPAVGNDCSHLQPDMYVCVGLPSTPTSKPSSTPSPTNGPSPQQTGIDKTCNNFYKTVADEYCQGIVDRFGTFSIQDLYKWNPALGNNCQYLQVGYYVCVGVPGTPTSKPSTTSKPSATPTGKGPQPQQTGIVSTCNNWYQVIKDEYCQGIVDRFGTFSIADFYKWNPALGNNCQYLQVGYYVCVGVPGTPTSKPSSTSKPSATPTGKGPQPQQTGIISTCNNWYQVIKDEYCQGIVDRFGTFTLQDLYKWNPALGDNCQYLQVGYNVCVGVPGTPTAKPTSKPSPTPTGTGPQPQQSGTVKNCKKYYKVQKGQGCWDVQQSQGVSEADWAKWNPGVKADCSNLLPDVYVCVGV